MLHTSFFMYIELLVFFVIVLKRYYDTVPVFDTRVYYDSLRSIGRESSMVTDFLFFLVFFRPYCKTRTCKEFFTIGLSKEKLIILGKF